MVCWLHPNLVRTKETSKSVTQMSTMNSACTVLKSTFGLPTFLYFLYGNNSSKVGVLVADYATPFHPTPSSILKSTYNEVGNGFADIPLLT